MLKFATRELARAFARKNEAFKLIDMGKESAIRWAVKVI